MGRDKQSALGAMVADLGSSAAHTPGAPENSGDLLLDQELELFAEGTVRPPVKRGAGRPPGSVNRSTLKLKQLLMARGYRDPAEFLAAIVTMDARELAASLRGTGLGGDTLPVNFDQAMEALKLQKAAAAELMPYFHQRMPIQVDHQGDGARPLIIITDGVKGAAMGGAGDGLSIHGSATIETKANQEVSDDED